MVIIITIEPVVYRDSMFGEGDGPIVYTNMECEGFERDLRYCEKDMYPYSTCSRNKQVGVLCKDGKNNKKNFFH